MGFWSNASQAPCHGIVVVRDHEPLRRPRIPPRTRGMQRISSPGGRSRGHSSRYTTAMAERSLLARPVQRDQRDARWRAGNQRKPGSRIGRDSARQASWRTERRCDPATSPRRARPGLDESPGERNECCPRLIWGMGQGIQARKWCRSKSLSPSARPMDSRFLPRISCRHCVKTGPHWPPAPAARRQLLENGRRETPGSSRRALSCSLVCGVPRRAFSRSMQVDYRFAPAAQGGIGMNGAV